MFGASISASAPPITRRRRVTSRKTPPRPLITSVPIARPAWTIERPPANPTIYSGTDYRTATLPGGGLTAIPALPMPRTPTVYSGTVPGLMYQGSIVDSATPVRPGGIVQIPVPDPDGGMFTEPPGPLGPGMSPPAFNWYDTPMGKVWIVGGVLVVGGLAWFLLKDRKKK